MWTSRWILLLVYHNKVDSDTQNPIFLSEWPQLFQRHFPNRNYGTDLQQFNKLCLSCLIPSCDPNEHMIEYLEQSLDAIVLVYGFILNCIFRLTINYMCTRMTQVCCSVSLCPAQFLRDWERVDNPSCLTCESAFSFGGWLVNCLNKRNGGEENQNLFISML